MRDLDKHYVNTKQRFNERFDKHNVIRDLMRDLIRV